MTDKDMAELVEREVSAVGRPELRIVPDAPEPTATEVLLSIMIPSLISTEALVVRLRALVDEQRRELAKERGVAFIRDEQIRQEFGNGQ